MSKQYIVVDENDNIIGYKENKEDIDPIKEFYRVAALRLTNSRGEILIAQRAYTKSHSPGKRGPAVAGTVEKGESYEENIIKETEEEIGLVNIPITLGPKTKVIQKYSYFIQRFFAIIDKEISEFIIPREEVEAIKRISREELQKDVGSNPQNYSSNMKKYIDTFS